MARALQFFDWTGPLMSLLAAIIALTTLMPKQRADRDHGGGRLEGADRSPADWAAAFVSLIGVVNRELGIPAVDATSSTRMGEGLARREAQAVAPDL